MATTGGTPAKTFSTDGTLGPASEHKEVGSIAGYVKEDVDDDDGREDLIEGSRYLVRSGWNGCGL